MKKQLRLGDTTKSPPFRGGLDWDKIKADYRARLEEERARGINTREHELELDMSDEDRQRFLLGEKVKSEKAKEARSKGKEERAGVGGPKPRFDVDEMVRLYVDERMTVAQICERLGVKSPTTVSNWLKKREVFEKHRDRKAPPVGHHGGGRKRSDTCGKGHDLTLPGASVERLKTLPDGSKRPNGRECMKCKQERDAEYGPLKWAYDPRNPNNRRAVPRPPGTPLMALNPLCLCGHKQAWHEPECSTCGCRKYYPTPKGE